MLYAFRYRHLFPAPKSCGNYVTTSIIEKGNRSLLSNLKYGDPILHRPNVRFR